MSVWLSWRVARVVLKTWLLLCVAGALSLQLASCSCSAVGCSSKLVVELTSGSLLERAHAEALALEVQTDEGTTRCHFAAFSAGRCESNGRFNISLMPSAATPDTHVKGITWTWDSVRNVKRLSILKGDERLLTKEFKDGISPTKVSQPNGAFCGPTCFAATVPFSM